MNHYSQTELSQIIPFKSKLEYRRQNKTTVQSCDHIFNIEIGEPSDHRKGKSLVVEEKLRSPAGCWRNYMTVIGTGDCIRYSDRKWIKLTKANVEPLKEQLMNWMAIESL